jgi:thioester reductase-like protein
VRNLAAYGLEIGQSEVLTGRITVITGDLGAPDLGLLPHDLDALASSIDAIYHNAAYLNFIYTYRDLRQANVVGTAAMLRLACRRSIPFHYTSTLGVFRRMGEHRREGNEPDDPNDLLCGYVQSKSVAEKLVRTAAKRGLPVSIYRPGQITGDTGSARTPSDDFLAVLFGGMAELGYAPREWFTEGCVPISPVDCVARFIRIVSTRRKPNGETYHVVVPDLVGPAEQLDRLRTRGHKIEMCGYDEWLQRLTEERRSGKKNPLQVLRHFLSILDRVPPLEPPSCRNAIEAFGGPLGEPLSTETFERWLDFLESQRLLPKVEGVGVRAPAG